MLFRHLWHSYHCFQLIWYSNDLFWFFIILLVLWLSCMLFIVGSSFAFSFDIGSTFWEFLWQFYSIGHNGGSCECHFREGLFVCIWRCKRWCVWIDKMDSSFVSKFPNSRLKLSCVSWSKSVLNTKSFITYLNVLARFHILPHVQSRPLI